MRSRSISTLIRNFPTRSVLISFPDFIQMSNIGEEISPMSYLTNLKVDFKVSVCELHKGVSIDLLFHKLVLVDFHPARNQEFGDILNRP